MLRITINESDDTMAICLEGRIAGPWAEELGRAWAEAAPRLSSRALSIDLTNVTYADRTGKQVLREIYSLATPMLIASSSWTHYLVQEITQTNSEPFGEA
jgi:anti-anti-sigma regulatory factor